MIDDKTAALLEQLDAALSGITPDDAWVDLAEDANKEIRRLAAELDAAHRMIPGPTPEPRSGQVVWNPGDDPMVLLHAAVSELDFADRRRYEAWKVDQERHAEARRLAEMWRRKAAEARQMADGADDSSGIAAHVIESNPLPWETSDRTVAVIRQALAVLPADPEDDELDVQQELRAVIAELRRVSGLAE